MSKQAVKTWKSLSLAYRLRYHLDVMSGIEPPF